MSNVLENPAPAPSVAATKYSAEAQEWLSRLRAMAEAFPDETDPKPLTTGEIIFCRRMSVVAMEKAAALAETSSDFGRGAEMGEELRDAVAFQLAYAGVVDQVRALAHRIDMAIMRRKLKASRKAQVVYRVGQSFGSVSTGEQIKTLMSDLKRAMNPRRRKAAAVPAAEPAETPAVAVKK